MGVYFVFIVIVGVWYARRSNRDPASFFLGGRGLGPWVSALSAEASDMSGWLLMGLPGVAYFTGVGEAFWTALGLAAGTWINWQIVAKRLRTYSETAGDSFTLPGFFSNRYHDTRKALSVIAAVLLILFFSIYAGAQFVAFGKLFDYVVGTHRYYALMVLIGAAIVFIYTLLGGFLGESFADLVQALLMISAIILVFAFGVYHVGGVSQVAENLRSFPRFMDIFGIATPVMENGVQAVSGGRGVFGPGADYSFLNIVSCLAWGLGYFGMPQVLLRFMAIKQPSKLRQARAIGVTWCFISLFAAVGIGLLGRAWQPGLLTTAGDAETIFLRMAVTFFPPLLAGLVLSGILGASMSSCDSYMLITSSSLANDLMKGWLKKDLSDKAVLWLARASILLVTLFGLFVALTGADSIFRIVSYAWAGLGAAFGPLILFSLFWKRTTLAGAAAGMISGGVTVVLWKNVISKLGGPFTVYELLPAFIISCLAIFAVSLATPRPAPDIEREFEQAKAQAALI
jgi:sodium/proline symporter